MEIMSLATEMAYALLLIVLLPLTFLIFRNLFIKSSSPPLPPGPSTWSLLGKLLGMGKKRHVTLANLAKDYGPIMSLRLGTQVMIIASSPEAAKEILKTHDRVLSGRFVPDTVPANESKIRRGMGWSECDEGWRSLRSVCRSELFSAGALELQASLRERKAMELVQQIRKMEGKVVNIRELGFAAVFNMLSNIIMSRDLINVEGDGAKKEEIMRAVVGINEAGSMLNISDFIPILRGLDLQGLKRKINRLLAEACGEWAPIVCERRARKGRQDSRKLDFLDFLIANDFVDDEIIPVIFV